jgi:hypothetical protein
MKAATHQVTEQGMCIPLNTYCTRNIRTALYCIVKSLANDLIAVIRVVSMAFDKEFSFTINYQGCGVPRNSSTDSFRGVLAADFLSFDDGVPLFRY